MKRYLRASIITALLVCVLVALLGSVAWADQTNRTVLTNRTSQTNQTDQTNGIDKSAIDKGIITVSYNSTEDKALILMVEKDAKRYYYPLKHDGTKENFPLQMGNGDYKITVLQNIAGTKYSVLLNDTATLNLVDGKIVYLTSIQNVNWNNEMQAMMKADALVLKAKTEKEKAAAIYKFIVMNYKYDFDKVKNIKSDYIPDVESMYEVKKGICYDYSALLASMLRKEGIPTRLIKGYCFFTDTFHAWNEIYVSSRNEWVVVDTTADAQYYKAKVKYSMEKSKSKYTTVDQY